MILRSFNQSQTMEWFMNGEMGRMWKEWSWAVLSVMVCYLFGMSEGYRETSDLEFPVYQPRF
jgi:hypothetical protein